jgi:peptide/nickel transport system substrate-binding protein
MYKRDLATRGARRGVNNGPLGRVAPADAADTSTKLTRRDVLQRGGGAALGLTLASALAGCGSSSPTSRGNSTTLTWPIDGDPISLDYTQGLSGNGAPFCEIYLEQLLFQDPTGLTPCLAAAYRTVSPTQYEFDLRKGVKFHDGTVMTPADAVYSIQRQYDPTVGSNYETYFSDVKDVTADLNTVIITLKQPSGLWPWAASTAFVTSKAFVERYGSKVGQPNTGFIGTGPYKFASWVKGQGLSYAKFADYWNRDNAPQGFQRISTPIVPDPTAVTAGLLSGELNGDFVEDYDQIPVLKSSSRIAVTAAQALGCDCVMLNCSRPPFDNPKVRQALALVMDRPGFIKSNLYGYGSIPAGIIPPSGWGSGEVYRLWEQGTKPLTATTDLAKAKDLLAGQGKVSASVLALQGQQTWQDMATALSAGAAEVGVNLSVDVVSATEFYGAIENTKEGAFDAIAYAPGADYYTPYGFLYFWQSQFIQVNGLNYSRYSDPLFDRLVAEASNYPSGSMDQAKALIAANARLMDQMGTIVVAWNDWVLAMDRGLVGYEISPNYFHDSFVDHLHWT